MDLGVEPPRGMVSSLPREAFATGVSVFVLVTVVCVYVVGTGGNVLATCSLWKNLMGL